MGSHGTENKISHGMGMGIKCMGMEMKTWEWEYTFCAWYDVSFELPDGNGRKLGIAGWGNIGMGFKFQMGMGIKSLRDLVRKIYSRTSLLYMGLVFCYRLGL